MLVVDIDSAWLFSYTSCGSSIRPELMAMLLYYKSRSRLLYEGFACHPHTDSENARIMVKGYIDSLTPKNAYQWALGCYACFNNEASELSMHLSTLLYS